MNRTDSNGGNKVRRTLALLCCGLACVLATVAPAHAAGNGQRQQKVNWNQRDTAVYVVSTINLVRSRSGKALATALAGKLDVTRYVVYDDSALTDLYFVELKRDDGSVAGTLAYQLGWPKPRTVTQSLTKLGVAAASADIADAYHTDPKVLIGSFSSTLP
jgi:hypothetical protein